jgi:N-acetyl-anhydromuramyl-L-alanine amidase AmpD
MKNKVMVHHTASSRLITTLEKVNEWHKDRGFNLSQLGFYVGYHFIIDMDGNLRQTRNIDEDGCHCNTFDTGEVTSFNRSSIGICVFGNFEDEYPTAEQLNTLTNIIKELQPTLVLGHRDVKDTLCPGKFLYSKVIAMRNGCVEEQGEG